MIKKKKLILKKDRRKTKKGQIKVQQMAFMLVAVTLFFAIAGLFIFRLFFVGVNQAGTDIQEENARLLVSRLASSPEFYCGESFAFGESNCIDTDKIMVLIENIEKYNNFWKVAEIQIRKVHPSEGGIECNGLNYPNCDIFNVYSENVDKGREYSNFVSLCRKENAEEELYDKCELGLLLVNYKEFENE